MKIAIGPSSFASNDKRPMNILANAGLKIIPNPFGRRLNENEVIEVLKDADGLIAGLEPLNRNVLCSAKNLKAISRVGVGMDNVDLETALELGIKVSNTPDGPTYAVAELTLASMIFLFRRILEMNSSLHSGHWNKVIGGSIKDTNVLIIGYGRIGRALSGLLQPFKPNILVYDPFIKKDDLRYSEKLVQLNEGLAIAKIISLHAYGREVILGKEAFNKMAEGVIILNSARAELIDENSIVNALKQKKVTGAWFDTFWQEPYKGRLAGMPNVLLTPHVATYTEDCRLRMEKEAVLNLLKDLEIDYALE